MRHSRFVNVTDHDVRAPFGVRTGECQADSTGATGDDRDSAAHR
jgi:hypothetical protein